MFHYTHTHTHTHNHKEFLIVCFLAKFIIFQNLKKEKGGEKSYE